MNHFQPSSIERIEKKKFWKEHKPSANNALNYNTKTTITTNNNTKADEKEVTLDFGLGTLIHLVAFNLLMP